MSCHKELTIDEKRLKESAYQYLCHLEEARLWIQDCLKEKLKPGKEFESRLRNGVVLAKLGSHIAPHIVPIKKIYDIDEKIYERSGLQYHHIDNINLWIAAMSAVGLPELFYPNAFDLYGRKDMPKAVYCIHALSLHLYRVGEGIKMLDLWGKIRFSDEEIDSVRLDFTSSEIQLPSFKQIRCILNNTVTPNNVNLNAAVIAINIAISQESSENLCSALLNPNAVLKNVVAENAHAYLTCLSTLKVKSAELKNKMDFKNYKVPADFLTLNVIQSSIDSVNLQEIFKLLKSSLLPKNIKLFMSILNHPLLDLTDIISNYADAYFQKYTECLENLEVISQNDLQALITNVNNSKKLISGTEYLSKLDLILEGGNFSDCFTTLKANIFNEPVHEFGAEFYHKHLAMLKRGKGKLSGADIQRPAQLNLILDNVETLVNLQAHIRGFLTRRNIIKGITELKLKNAALKIQSFLKMSIIRRNYLQQKEKLINFQAHVRGFLIRRKGITELKLKNAAHKIQSFLKMSIIRRNYLQQRAKFINFQAHVRGFLIRRNVLKRIPELKLINAARKIQSFLKMSIIRRNYLKQKAKKLKMLNAVKLIQRCWRAFKVKQNLKLLTHSSSPPLSLIQNIICMLEISNDDYSEELRLHNIQSEVIHNIRYNQDLLKELDEMDLKIKLLIQNHITLEELISQKNSREKKKLKEGSDKNLPIFSRTHKVFIERFENLLHLLQTKPHYLAKLIINLPINEANSFVESIVFSIYNYGSTPLEECFLLKLLHKALEEEIISKVDKLSDVIKDDRFVVKIVLSLYRKIYQPENLKKLFQPLLCSVLEDHFLSYSSNPVDIYKVWRNEIEIETGKKSELPCYVTVEEALCHEEVNYRFNTFLDRLVTYSVKVCNVIINSQNILPYGIMYMAKVLREVLMKKFPYASHKELYQIIGNFLYYRFINPIIVAPDSFEILDNLLDDNINDNDRMKLSFVAKFLQFAAVGKEYSEDHLMCLNPYLRDCHENFLSFFEEVCNISNLDDRFNICPFAETIMTSPKVYLNPQELISLYKLLTKNEYILAPDSADILHEVLEEFDADLLNDILENTDKNILSTELCLSLKCIDKLEDDTSDEEKIYLQTKFMLITLMQVFPSQEYVVEFLNLETSSETVKKFEGFSFAKQINSIGYNATDSEKFQNWKTLSSFQKALQYNLNILELNGYVSIKNNYQDILNDIAEGIVNRWKYRISRKSEIEKLLEILKTLKSKQLYYFEKLDYYNKYIAVCLENFKFGEKFVHRKFPWKRTSDDNLKSKVLTYSGSKLHEKGILLEIQGLSKCQLKHIFFEIGSSENPGVFIVRVKFMGKYFETVNVDIQDLLSYKYQGIAVIKLNECVKVNNNFLLHLLNVKFYHEKK